MCCLLDLQNEQLLNEVRLRSLQLNYSFFHNLLKAKECHSRFTNVGSGAAIMALWLCND